MLAAVMVAAALLSHLRRYSDGGNDAFIIWNLRARWLYRAGEDFRSAFSPDLLFWSHADYPLLLPTILVRGFTVLGRARQSRSLPYRRIAVSIDRLFIQIWPMILVLIACRFNPGQGRPSPRGGESLPHAAA